MTTKNNMNAVEDYACGTNQKDLAAGVLKQAGLDLRRFHGATSAVERELYLDAYSWVISDDSSWPFSFLNVCQLLNLTPDIVRQRRRLFLAVLFREYLPIPQPPARKPSSGAFDRCVTWFV